jgi:transcriptional regulator GlxA family with amidase domain
MALALLLLADRHLSLGEIAVATGFPDAARFGRAFGNWVGECPARYRRKLATATSEMA